MGVNPLGPDLRATKNAYARWDFAKRHHRCNDVKIVGRLGGAQGVVIGLACEPASARAV
jgi:hypothetical protein